MLGDNKMPNGDQDREFVCAACIEEEYLQEVVRGNLTETKCDYCGVESHEPIACYLDEVIKVIEETVGRYYEDPDEGGAPWDPEEGDYFCSTFTSEEIFDNLGFSLANDMLFEDINSHFSDIVRSEVDWVLLTPLERKQHGWDRFKKVVTHQRRFTFWNVFDDSEIEGHPDNLPTANVLPEIAEAINLTNCFREIGVDTDIWRVRIHGADTVLESWSDLSTPPEQYAVFANRMSPAGVPMFYGAADFDTAVREAFEPGKGTPPRFATGSIFRPARPLLLLDLTNLPGMPSIFRPGTESLRNAIVFLDNFLEELTRPVTKDGCEHIGYIPTQVFSEFIRYEFKHAQRQGLDGIVYPSSHNAESCYVIFAIQEQCTDVIEPWQEYTQMLTFAPESIRKVQLP
jgi:hypothetical protein